MNNIPDAGVQRAGGVASEGRYKSINLDRRGRGFVLTQELRLDVKRFDCVCVNLVNIEWQATLFVGEIPERDDLSGKTLSPTEDVGSRSAVNPARACRVPHRAQ